MSERLRRLLLVVPAALARPGIRVPELARQLDCDVRELRKDLDLLACVGAPPFSPDDLIDIELRGDEVYVTLPQAFDRPTRLSATEAAALAAAARALAPQDPHVASATAKLAGAVPAAQKALYEGLLGRFAAEPPDGTVDVARILSDAAEARKTTEILYFAHAELAARTRRVKPRTVASADGVSYLSATNERGEERLYRVDRIVRARMTDEAFEPLPPVDLAADLARVARFHEAEGLPKATLRFAASVAAAAMARHRDARALDGGRLEADVPYASLPWLVSYVLSWGGAAVVVAPDEARQAALDAVARARAT